MHIPDNVDLQAVRAKASSDGRLFAAIQFTNQVVALVFSMPTHECKFEGISTNPDGKTELKYTVDRWPVAVVVEVDHLLYEASVEGRGSRRGAPPQHAERRTSTRGVVRERGLPELSRVLNATSATLEDISICRREFHDMALEMRRSGFGPLTKIQMAVRPMSSSKPHAPATGFSDGHEHVEVWAPGYPRYTELPALTREQMPH